MFVKEIYETLRFSPQWNQTLMIVTYDEHGGFFDHVPTPVQGVPSPDGIVGPPPYNFTFDRLGVRVPAILISPWIEKGTVVHGPNGPTPTSQYEHSSVPATTGGASGWAGWAAAHPKIQPSETHRPQPRPPPELCAPSVRPRTDPSEASTPCTQHALGLKAAARSSATLPGAAACSSALICSRSAVDSP
uniref:Phosphoesterase family protein n=1 Tax=Arundo donax TaxID=35708 RepID=A0A0A9GPH1_ARUDO